MNNINRNFVKVLMMFLIVIGMSYSFAITDGPYLVDQTESGVTIVWLTDEDAISYVEYGSNTSYGNRVDGAVQGLMRVGTVHSVRLDNLTSGTEYHYRVASEQANNYVAYWASTGATIKSNGSSFTTFDEDKNGTSFYFVADVKNSGTLLNSILSKMDYTSTDFVVLGGNCLSNIQSKSEILSNVIDPVCDNFGSTIPLVYLRGNLEMNGEAAQSLIKYFPSKNSVFYGAFIHGGTAFLKFDPGQDVSDDDSKFSNMMRSDNLRKKQMSWYKTNCSNSSSLISNAELKIAFCNNPEFGFGDNSSWKNYLSEVDTKLLLSGYKSEYTHLEPTGGNSFHTIITGEDNFCKVTTTGSKIDVIVYDKNGTEVNTVTIE